MLQNYLRRNDLFAFFFAYATPAQTFNFQLAIRIDTKAKLCSNCDVKNKKTLIRSFASLNAPYFVNYKFDKFCKYAITSAEMNNLRRSVPFIYLFMNGGSSRIFCPFATKKKKTKLKWMVFRNKDKLIATSFSRFVYFFLFFFLWWTSPVIIIYMI